MTRREPAVKLAKKKTLPLPRVRYEPPTIEEAISAAGDMATELDAQVEIAAALMGMTDEEVRPLVSRALAPRRAPLSIASTTTSLNLGLGRRVVVVERKGVRVPLRQQARS